VIFERRNRKSKTTTWEKRLSRIFNIDIGTCEVGQGHVKIIAFIEDPVVIDKILTHLENKEEQVVNKIYQVRAPPEFILVIPKVLVRIRKQQ
jgi:hypothetical protein